MDSSLCVPESDHSQTICNCFLQLSSILQAADGLLDYLVLMALCQQVIDLRRSSDVLDFHGSERVGRLNWHNLQSADLDHTLSSWVAGIGEKQRDVDSLIFYHVCQLHLHTSIDAIETLAGKEDQAEARRVLPGLLAWVSKESSRAAVWRKLLSMQGFRFMHINRQTDVILNGMIQ